MPYKILIAGPQGSGKGTQADILAKALGVPALSMGQLLRDEVLAGTDIGKKVGTILNAGNLVPEDLAAAVLKARLDMPDAQDGYVLDGFPRNLAQLAAFTFDVPNHVVVIDIPRDESLRRLVHRLTCEKCGEVYNQLDGFLEGDTCKKCGGKIVKRKDDTAEAIDRRLSIYERNTKPVLDHYETQGIVHYVSGVGSIPDVARNLLAVVQES